MLRHSIQKVPNQWDLALKQFEYKYNSQKHCSSSFKPFEVDMGQTPPPPRTRKPEHVQL